MSAAERSPGADQTVFPNVDRGQIEQFVRALFRYADDDTIVSLRAFRDDIDGVWEASSWPAVRLNGRGLDSVVDTAAGFAQCCAAALVRVVFAPPVCTFRSTTAAAEKDIANGLCLTVECDQAALQAHEALELILGPATVVVASGGEWFDPQSGEFMPKLHLHWRLTEPTRAFPDHVRLKEARRLAKRIVGSDGSAVPLVHPLRWPGSWHRKAEPRMARIIGGNPDAEIDLTEAYEKLSEATAAMGSGDFEKEQPRASSEPQADEFDVIAALAVIPNNDLPWNEWIEIGLATWRATGGSAVGFAAWAAWSGKSTKNDPAVTRERWEHFSQSPPDRIGAGTLFYKAAQARKGWRKPSSMNNEEPFVAPRGGSASCPPGPAQPWPTIEPEAFYGIAGDIVRAIQPHTEADPVGILIASAGNSIGRGPYYRVEGDRHGSNIDALLVGETAKGRKGTAGGRVRQIMEVADPQWAKDRMQNGGLSSREGVIWAVRDEIKQYERRRGKGADPECGEMVTVDPGVVDKRLYILETEFSAALTVMKREGNILSRIVRDGWDRGDLGTLTKNSPTRATGAHISVVGHITADELRRELDRTSMGNGYANRFLFVCVRRANVLPFGGALDEETICTLGMRLRSTIEAARGIGQVTMTARAGQAWREVYPTLSEGEPGLLGAIIGRAEAQVVRLALIYALLDRCAQIDIGHLQSAIALWEYCEASVRYIFGDALGDPIADEILRALRQAGEAGMTRTQIRDLFGRNRGADRIGLALSTLERHGKAKKISRNTGGRPAEVWVAED